MLEGLRSVFEIDLDSPGFLGSSMRGAADTGRFFGFVAIVSICLSCTDSWMVQAVSVRGLEIRNGGSQPGTADTYSNNCIAVSA